MVFSRVPMSKKVRRFRKVRRIRRVRFRKPVVSKIVRLPRALPAKLVIPMRYCTNVRLDASTGTPSQYTYSATSIYDPDSTGIGHQPYTHDQFLPIYNQYRVLKSKITVTFISNGSSSTGHQVCLVWRSNNGGTVGDFDTIRETKSAHYKLMADQSTKTTVTHGYNSKKHYPANYDNINALMGASPSEQVFFCVATTGVNPSVEPVSVDCIVTIDYTVMMWDLKVLPQS